MRTSLIALLLLASTAIAQNCLGCTPPAQIKACSDYHCYRCDRNEELNLHTRLCDCREGFYRVNGRCRVCPEGYYYDEDLQWCVGIDTCGPNQVLIDGICQCQPGLIVIQNICQRCPENQTYYPQYDACRCSPGYSLVDGNCILVTCGKNQVYSDKEQKCVCEIGYYLINGVCDRCPKGKIYNSKDQTCEDPIAPVCGFNEYWYECCCFCELGYIRISGVCVKCPKHSSYNWHLNACVCDEGYYFVGEEIKQLPYQSRDTGSSFTSNPGRIYSGYGPSWGSGNSATLVSYSNYDASGVNTNGPNVNNIVLVANHRN